MLWLMMGKEPKGLRIEIESKIEYHPVLKPLGPAYQSIRRAGLNNRQHPMSEDAIEKSYQSRLGLPWAGDCSVTDGASN